MKKPTTKPSVHKMNKALNKFLAAGINTYAENVRQRGFWAQLMSRRPKHRRRAVQL